MTELENLLRILEDVKEQFQREEDQAILNHNLFAAVTALAGKDAIERIRRTLELRAGAEPRVLRAANRPK